MEQPNDETPKFYIRQILDLQILEDEQIEKIHTMSDTDKMDIIISMNKVITSLIYVLMLP
jgi:hypothetical protein